jgi:hypothetical protein
VDPIGLSLEYFEKDPYLVIVVGDWIAIDEYLKKDRPDGIILIDQVKVY